VSGDLRPYSQLGIDKFTGLDDSLSLRMASKHFEATAVRRKRAPIAVGVASALASDWRRCVARPIALLGRGDWTAQALPVVS